MGKGKALSGALNTPKPLPYLLLLPNILLLVVFTFYPFLRSIYLSLFVTDTLGNPAAYVGLENFRRVLTSNGFLESLKVTFQFAGMVGVGTFVIALFFAYLCVDKVRGSRVYQTMFALPIALASAPICAIAMFYLNRNGLVNNLFGTTNAWLSSESTALICCAIVTVWANVGTSFIFLLVGFRNVPDHLVESSKIDGAGYVRRFLNIYFPIASPQIFFVMFLNIIQSFKAFAVIKILMGKMNNSYTNVLVYALYSNAFLRGRFETACVYALMLCLIIFIFTRIQLLFEKRMVHYQ